MHSSKIPSQRGFSLISVLMLVGLLLSVSAALAVRVRLDTSNQAAFHTTPQNLALAEAGVNQAIAQFRDIFIDGNIPTGSSTSHTGNYALQSVSLGGQPINYQLDQPLTNPTNKQLPLGVPFGGLNVLQYNYAVTSGAPDITNPAAQLRSQFQVNNIPTFQFLAYYNSQLEITPAEDMTLHGRIHSNGDLYLSDSGNTVTIADLPPYQTTVQVSAVGNIYRKRSDDGSCSGTVTISKLQDTASPLCTSGGTVSCLDPQDLACQSGGAAVSTSTLNTWQGSMRSGVPNIGLPPGYSTVRGAAAGYWASADIRIVLDLNSSNDYNQKATSGGSTISLHSILVQNADGSTDTTKTTLLRSFMHANPGAIFYNDVPVTSSGGTTRCTSSSTAATYVSPSYSSPSSPCDGVTIAGSSRYNPAFQGSGYVYRRVDENGGSNNRSSNWTLGTGSGQDSLGQNTPGTGTALGDYRRGGFYNNRENKFIYLLNVDLQDLLTWNNAQTSGNKLFDPTASSNGGTVMFLSVMDSSNTTLTNGINNFGVRILDSPVLPSFTLNITNPQGITVASDQAMYLEGNYNIGPYSPTGSGPTGIPWTHVAAAVIGDTLNVLSQNWEAPATASSTTYSNDQKSVTDLSGTTSTVRDAGDTTIYTAFLAGVDPVSSGYSGGLQNYPRLHENWDNNTLGYRGSFVSLSNPVHQNGAWSSNGTSYNMYTVPTRNWDYDVQFQDVAMLPPMTPTFISVQQIVFSEDFR
jgi:hypothetical protein